MYTVIYELLWYADMGPMAKQQNKSLNSKRGRHDSTIKPERLQAHGNEKKLRELQRFVMSTYYK